MSARRAVIRWGWRLFRREWRQQLLVTALLVLAVTAATIGISAAHSLIPLGQTARLGDANQMFVFDGLEPDAARTHVAAIEERFGTIGMCRSPAPPTPSSSARRTPRVRMAPACLRCWTAAIRPAPVRSP